MGGGSYFVYILKCNDGTLYTGYTVNLEERLQKHNRGLASKYTRRRRPVEIVYHEAFLDRAGAMRRESAVKKMDRREKLALINGKAKIVISACLAGKECRYSGDGFDYPDLRRLVEEGCAVPVCPEVAGGLPVPREPCEIRGGDGFDVLDGRARVFDKSGEDRTGAFIDGARQIMEQARRAKARLAVLKERSPSCGSTVIYDGTFSGRRIPGCGCAAAMLYREGLELCSEMNYKMKIDWCRNKS